MCSGRVDLDFLLRAFANGLDGVFVGGCRLNECNYVTQGNYHALNTALLGRRLLEHLGLNPERLSIAFMSGGEGTRFVEVSNAFAAQVQALGPLGSSEGLDPVQLQSKLAELRKLVPYIKQVKKEKLRTPLRSREQDETYFTRDEIDTLLREVVSYYIEPEKCQACMICARRCPAQAILSAKQQVHVIEQDKCIRCGTCQEVCPPQFDAVAQLRGQSVPPPLPERERAIVRKVKETA